MLSSQDSSSLASVEKFSQPGLSDFQYVEYSDSSDYCTDSIDIQERIERLQHDIDEIKQIIDNEVIEEEDRERIDSNDQTRSEMWVYN